MKRTVLMVTALLACSTLFAGDPPKPEKVSSDLERMKALAGSWVGKMQDGKTFHVTYRVISEGSALLETMDMPEHAEDMVTVYHSDGDGVVMTHYCSMGNQPRMRLDKDASKGDSFVFAFADATNLSSPDDAHMHHLVVTLKDKNHMTEEWTMRAGGKDGTPDVFELTRKKK